MSLDQDLSPMWSLDTLERTVSRYTGYRFVKANTYINFWTMAKYIFIKIDDMFDAF